MRRFGEDCNRAATRSEKDMKKTRHMAGLERRFRLIERREEPQRLNKQSIADFVL
jgi:hypothetical protein